MSCTSPAKRRILFVDHTAQMGGGEIALLNLVRALRQSRVEPVVVLFSDGPLAARLAEAEIEIHILQLSADVVQTRKDTLGIRTLLRLKDVAATVGHARRLARFIKTQRIDLVHTNSLKADLIGGLAAKLARRPLVWHVRDRIEDDYLPRPVVRVFRWLSQVLPDLVIANSAATLDTIRLVREQQGEAVPSGIDLPARLRVVHDGIGAIPQCEQAGHATAIERRVGLVGRISPWKGQHIFLQAAALVHRRFPEVRFAIIGSAMFNEEPYEQSIRNLARDLGIADIVEFTGFREDVTELIEQLEVLVHASTTGEPFGQVVVEGMAAAKPVVATAGGGIPEIVQDGVTGLLVPMGDVQAMAAAICRLLEDPHTAREMGLLGRHRVREHFTIHHVADKVEKLYDEVFTSRTAPRPGRGIVRRLVSTAAAEGRGLRKSSDALTMAATVLAMVVMAAAVAMGTRLAVAEQAPISAPFMAVIAICAGIFGRRAGFLASFLSALALAFFVLSPRRSFALYNLVHPSVLFCLTIGLLISGLIGMFQSASDRAQSAGDRADAAREAMDFLATAGAALSLPATTQGVLQTIGYLAVSRLCDECRIDLLSDGGALVAVHQASRDWARQEMGRSDILTRRGDDHPVMRCLRSGSPLVSGGAEDPSAGPLDHRGSYLLVPMAARGQVLGVMSLISYEPGLHYRQQDLRVATDFAWRAAQALESVRQRKTAEAAEQSPSSPRLPAPVIESPGRASKDRISA